MQDAATGLTYMQQRYYDPQIGRFLSVDPVTADGNTGGNFNRYWYANNNPYRVIDPDGRYGFDRNSQRYVGFRAGSKEFFRDSAGMFGGGFGRAPGTWRKPLFERMSGLSPREVIGTSESWVASGDQDDWRSVRYTRQWANGDLSDDEYQSQMCPGCGDPVMEQVALYGLVGVATFGIGVEAGPAVGSAIHWLNQGRHFRVGVGGFGGRRVLRVAGEYLGKIPEPIRKSLGIKFDGKTYKWDWFDLGPK